MGIDGYCMCGQVKVTLSELPTETVFCHCDNCRRQSGAGGTYVAMLGEDNVQIEGNVKKYLDTKTDSGKPLDRYSCENCGCPIHSITPLAPGIIVVKMGLFDEVPKPTQEWYCKNKQDWEPTVDGVTSFRANPTA